MTNADMIRTSPLNMLAIIINCRREWLSQETVISKEASA